MKMSRGGEDRFSVPQISVRFLSGFSGRGCCHEENGVVNRRRAGMRVGVRFDK